MIHQSTIPAACVHIILHLLLFTSFCIYFCSHHLAFTSVHIVLHLLLFTSFCIYFCSHCFAFTSIHIIWHLLLFTSFGIYFWLESNLRCANTHPVQRRWRWTSEKSKLAPSALPSHPLLGNPQRPLSAANWLNPQLPPHALAPASPELIFGFCWQQLAAKVGHNTVQA